MRGMFILGGIVVLSTTIAIVRNVARYAEDNRFLQQILDTLKTQPGQFDYSHTDILNPAFYDVIEARGSAPVNSNVLLLVPSADIKSSEVYAWLDSVRMTDSASAVSVWVALTDANMDNAAAIARNGIPVRVIKILDPLQFSRASGIQMVPAAVVVQPTGRISALVIGPPTLAVIQDAIERGLGRRNVTGTSVYRLSGSSVLSRRSLE